MSEKPADWPSGRNGWTCVHVRYEKGPCPACAPPGNGKCGGCGRPMDDHQGWQPRRCYPAGQKVYA